jgi:hypothetical protein
VRSLNLVLDETKREHSAYATAPGVYFVINKNKRMKRVRLRVCEVRRVWHFQEGNMT